MKKFIFSTVLLSLIILPVFAFAQSDSLFNPKTLNPSNTTDPYKGVLSPGKTNTTPPIDSGNINAQGVFDPGTVNYSPLGKCRALVINAGDLLCRISDILNSIIPVLIALGVVYFVWGVVQYMIGSDEEAKKKGRDRIIYGIIGLTVIVGLWGLVAIVLNTFGLDSVAAPTVDLIQSNPGRNGASCGLGSSPNFQSLADYVTCVINNSIIPLIFALAVVMFVWGVVQFVINSDEEAKKAKGKQFMIWGIVALAVMVSVWGLVSILGGTFGINTTVLPQVKPPGSQ